MREVVTKEMLEKLIGPAASPPATVLAGTNGVQNTNGNGRHDHFDLEKWISRFEPNAKGPDPWRTSGGTGRRWSLDVCAFNSDHGGGCAFIGQMPSGANVYQCLHDSCRAKGWKEFRALREPAYLDRDRCTGAAAPAVSNPPAGSRLQNGSNGSDHANGKSFGERFTEPRGKDENEPPLVLSTRTVRELVLEYPDLKESIIEGLLRRGETMNIVASAKAGKSWLVNDLAISMASGRSWLGKFQTRQGAVLVLDNELHAETMSHRIPKVAAARGITTDEYADSLHVQSLRGCLRDIYAIGPAIVNAFKPGDLSMIIVDAFYRALPMDTDENDNGSIAALYNAIDIYAKILGASFVLIHHTSKGIQGGKSVTDVVSGAGSNSRAADTHWVVRPHEEQGIFVVDAAVRSWPPIQPFCMRWDFPVWSIAEGYDPTKLKLERGRGGRPKKDAAERPAKEEKKTWDTEQFASEFITKKPADKKLILARAVEAGISKRDAEDKLLLAVDKGLIYSNTGTNGVTPQYSSQDQSLFEVSEKSEVCARARPPVPPHGNGRKSRSHGN